ncbi:MAG: DinB family protein [Pirellulales bacterium]
MTDNLRTSFEELPVSDITNDQLTGLVLKGACDVLDQCLVKIDHCVGQLSDEQVWWRPREEMNSIGNLLLHLMGNVRQWIIAGLGTAEDVRNRPAEFSQRGPIPKEELLAQMRQTVTDAKSVLAQRTAAEMLAVRRVQGWDVTGWDAMFDCVPHFKGHTQEIIHLTRLQLGDAYKFHWQPQNPEQGAK